MDATRGVASIGGGRGARTAQAQWIPSPEPRVLRTAERTGGKVKLSTVLDQADDTEIRAIGVQQLRELLAHW